MKILITCGIFEPEAGGPATYAPQLARKLIDRGLSVDLVTLSEIVLADKDVNYPFRITRIIRKNKISNYVRMFWFILKNSRNYDLIYTLDWFTVGIPLALATFFTRTKYIIRIGGDYIWERYLLTRGEPMPLKQFYIRGIYKKFPIFFYLIRFVFSRASLIIFNSVIQKDLFAEYYKLDANKLRTIFNPIPDDISRIGRDDIKKEISFAGRFIVMKNIENLIKAFVKADLVEYRLILIGDGPILIDMKRLVENLNITDRVEFIGRLPREEIYGRIKHSRYLILPSWTDIYPMQFYECLATGVPILITRENYLAERDIIPDQIDPHSINEIAEKMKYLDDDLNYAKFVKEFGNIHVTRGWDEVTEQHIEIFKKII